MKHSKFLGTVKAVAKQMFHKTTDTIKKDLNKLVIMGQIAAPVVLCLENWSIPGALVYSSLMCFVFRFITNVKRELDHTLESGLPIPVKRFTYKTEEGYVSLTNDQNMEEMLNYMNELEQYLQAKGALRNERCSV